MKYAGDYLPWIAAVVVVFVVGGAALKVFKRQ
jgi:hypothetical protein